MKARSVLVLLGLAAAVAVACSSSSPTTYTIDGTCGPLTVGSSGAVFTVHGPCALGQAGNFTLGASLNVTFGADGGVPVSIDAGFAQGGNILYSTFNGIADVPGNPLSAPIIINGAFNFSGGTGPYADATGHATADGGVDLAGLTASLNLVGSVSY
ncbi:MAG TPA: hypothetical protein VK454_06310 [Myxococcaceae bacterium]|nr:hypothetical protein [Myxococcaceae bacterium]